MIRKLTSRWKEKVRLGLNAAAAVIAFAYIIYATVLSRSPATEPALELKPFYLLSTTADKAMIKEYIRGYIMNMYLFFPLGLFLPFAMKKQRTIAFISAIVLSVIIEICQYCFMLGTAELDDVVFNTLGFLAGMIPFMVCERVRKLPGHFKFL